MCTEELLRPNSGELLRPDPGSGELLRPKSGDLGISSTQPTQEQAARLVPGPISTPKYKIAKEIHKDKSFISAADIFNKLPHVPRLNSIVYITTYYVLKLKNTARYHLG